MLGRWVGRWASYTKNFGINQIFFTEGADRVDPDFHFSHILPHIPTSPHPPNTYISSSNTHFTHQSPSTLLNTSKTYPISLYKLPHATFSSDCITRVFLPSLFPLLPSIQLYLFSSIQFYLFSSPTFPSYHFNI